MSKPEKEEITEKGAPAAIPRPCLRSEEKAFPLHEVDLRVPIALGAKDETPTNSYSSSSKKPLSAAASDDSRSRTKQYVDRLNASNDGQNQDTPTPRQTTRFNSHTSLGDRVKSVFNAISRSLNPPSAPSESLTNGTDLGTARSEWGAGVEFRLQSARSRRDSLLEDRDDDHTKSEEQYVDVVVIDRDFAEVLEGSGGSFGVAGSETAIAPNLDSGGINGLGITGRSPGSAGRSPGSNIGSREALSRSDRSQTEGNNRASHSGVSRYTNTTLKDVPVYVFFRWRIAPALIFFFEPAFPDPEKEASYSKERWFIQKPSAIAGAIFFYVAWIVTMASQTSPVPLVNKITYCSICAAAIAPTLLIVARDWPRRRPWLYNVFLFCAVWAFPYCQLIDIYTCGFYSNTPNCFGKDFLGLFFYSLAFPTFALFMMQQKRLFALIGSVVYIILVIGLIIPERPKFWRNLINFILFHIAIQWSSFLQEKSYRRMFSMREQLKAQFKATQKAQIAERKSAESKKSFVSYIFHEVRVPLNTALLAFQNLEGEEMFKHIPEDSHEMVTGLSSSLITMEKVLNDVLDFNRMEAGKLICTNKPFELHSSIRQILMAFRGVAAAKSIDFVLDLDPAIDEFSPYLLGDEMRIAQVISNLASNACKFTPTGGSVTFKSRLLYPVPEKIEEELEITIPVADETAKQPSDTLNLPAGDRRPEGERKDVAVVRMEISDSGVGIRPHDLINNRLFSPYVQTDIGRRQGGKGSGLGLALVRKIIKLSGGRLGVRSSVDSGSTFWFELPFEKSASLTPEAKRTTTSAPRDASILQTLDTPTPDGHLSAGPSRASLNIPGHQTGSLKDRAKNPIQRAELVASQIPIAMDASGVPVSSIPALTPIDDSQTTNLQVLIVDDDGLTRKLMTRMISRMGHDVTCAEDGLVALNLLRDAWEAKDENRYDMVFLDNQMPRMSGVEVVREARRIGLRTYVCGVTGNALKEDQDEYLAAGVDRILTKPVLERNVRDALEQARVRAAENQASSQPTSDYIRTPRHSATRP